jgi:hypothetical protein
LLYEVPIQTITKISNLLCHIDYILSSSNQNKLPGRLL